MGVAAGTDLRSLRKRPFELLQELERRGRVALTGTAGDAADVREWVGVGFRIADEQFIVARDDIREIMIVPQAITRVPGAKPWVRGLANVRGHLLPIVDLKAFLGAGTKGETRESRVLVADSSELSAGVIVDAVFGFRRFLDQEFNSDAPQTVARCDRYLDGAYERGQETWPVFSMNRLLSSDEFRNAAE